MEDNLDNKIEFKDRVISFYKENKFKIFTSIIFLIIIIASFISYKIYADKKNDLISEKYIEAGLYLSSNDKLNAKKIYKEIILSENKFYGALALNSILEKNLEKDKEKIISYFKIIEGLNYSKEQRDLISFKKALYLMKQLDTDEAKEILQNLIDSESTLKNLAEEILQN